MTALAVETERLLKELRNLWRDLARQDPDGVLRACAMTLIVVLDEERETQTIGETIAALMHEHPSRAILIRVRGCEERVLEARVYAQCWTPFGRRQQICCEQVEILSSPASLADTAAVVRGLVAPDLPVVLYCPSEGLWGLPQMDALFPLAHKIVVDSCSLPDGAAALEFLPKFRNASDLVWSRLTPWREAIAQIFEDPRRLRSVYDLSEVQILYKGPGEPSSAYYLAGWFMHVLGAGVKIRIAAGVGPEYARLAHVALYGPGLEAKVDIAERCTAETTIDGSAPRVTLLPVANEYFALREELGAPAEDRMFRDVLGLANLMRGAG